MLRHSATQRNTGCNQILQPSSPDINSNNNIDSNNSVNINSANNEDVENENNDINNENETVVSSDNKDNENSNQHQRNLPKRKKKTIKRLAPHLHHIPNNFSASRLEALMEIF